MKIYQAVQNISIDPLYLKPDSNSKDEQDTQTRLTFNTESFKKQIRRTAMETFYNNFLTVAV
jgi:hypothetical protein